MIQKTLIVAALLCGGATSAQPYARLEGDTLRLGNVLIERSFVWNDGDLMTASLTDKAAGVTRRTEGLRPDFVLGKARGAGGVLETVPVAASAHAPAYLLARVTYALGPVEVRREYRIYEQVPAIACDTWLRGTLAAAPDGSDVSAADRKNIESEADMASQAVSKAVLDQLSFKGKHWHGKAVEFRDVTDWRNNLVHVEDFISFHKTGWRGNLLFLRDGIDGGGLFFLKEAPCSSVQLHYGGSDFTTDFGRFQAVGLGIGPEDVSPDGWTRLYGCVTGVFGAGEGAALKALRSYQKTVRTAEEMVMMNTWGDRSQDAKVDEAFWLAELEKAARLGITHFQIDDGWQSGRSPNSKSAGGSFKDIWVNPDYWVPDPVKYPRGLGPIVERARELGIEVGLWFNPSVQDDFADWSRDAAALVALYRQYGIRVFKIDGLQIPSRKAEENLRRLLDTVRAETGDAVLFDLDVTAGRRTGYHYFGEYGNIFLENRYTDWGNYYPYQTLRNLWQLARDVPAERLQVEFLNPWRNAGRYPSDDPFAPSRYRFDDLFALTMAAQPLAWMEASNLPEEAFSLGGLVRDYRRVMADFHAGVILPVGAEPDGRAWTGFQSMTGERDGYLLIYREQSSAPDDAVPTWLPEGARVRLVPVLGEGKRRVAHVGADGAVRFHLSRENAFVLYRYTLQP